MEISKYRSMQNCDIPNDIAEQLKHSGDIHLTEFADKNYILSDSVFQTEIGYDKFSNGDYLVSMVCPMPGVTKEMIDWWFWWHTQADERYQLWFPGEHFKIGYAAKDKSYFNSPTQPSFVPNTQYPTEKIGRIRMPLVIDFVSAETFGFNAALMEKNQVATIVCGHVGAFYNIIQHTEMAHIFFKKGDGLFLVSRFWLGKRLTNPIIRHAMLNEKTARAMAQHCCVEYRNLAKILPNLYYEYAAK